MDENATINDEGKGSAEPLQSENEAVGENAPDPEDGGKLPSKKVIAAGCILLLAIGALALLFWPSSEPEVHPAELQSVLVAPSEALVRPGVAQQFVAIITYRDGSTASATAAAFWATSDSEVALIDSLGLVSTQTAGNVTITASVEGLHGTALLRVSETAPPPDGPPPVPIAHLENGCPTCHTEGIAGATLSPEDHEPYPEDVCLSCHRSLDAITSAPPEIPAGHYASPCSECHNSGFGGAPQWPNGHDSFSEGECQGCHDVSTVPLQDPTLIPAEHYPEGCSNCHAPQSGATTWPQGHSELSEANCGACHQVSSEPVDPLSTIPQEHFAASCTNCHDSGLGGATQWPQSHRVLAEDTCQNCHEVSGETSSEGLPSLPAGHYQQGCSLCHATGVGAAKQWPAGHETTSQKDCQTCHAPTGALAGTPARIPSEHPSDECGVCHTFSVTGPAPWPSGHDGLSNDDCQICHAQSTLPAATPGNTPLWHWDEDVAWYDGDPDCARCHSPTTDYPYKDTTWWPVWSESHSGLPSTVCDQCHETNTEGPDLPRLPLFADASACGSCHASSWPSNHASIRTADCQACHAQGTEEHAGVAYIPTDHWQTACMECHKPAKFNAPKWPDSHDDFTSPDLNRLQECTTCHLVRE